MLSFSIFSSGTRRIFAAFFFKREVGWSGVNFNCCIRIMNNLLSPSMKFFTEVFLLIRFGCLFTRRIAGCPRPVQVVAAAFAVNIEDFSGKIQSRHLL